MKKDYVIGIDCSTTATKAIVWDKKGVPIAEGREDMKSFPLSQSGLNRSLRSGGMLQ